MPTVFVRGDLFRQGGLHALAHGCNCAGSMGRGSAVKFRARIQEADARASTGSVFQGSARVSVDFPGKRFARSCNASGRAPA